MKKMKIKSHLVTIWLKSYLNDISGVVGSKAKQTWLTEVEATKAYVREAISYSEALAR